jgi:hypothetical protein
MRTPRREPPIEFALRSAHMVGLEGWRSLSLKTGLPIEKFAALRRHCQQ